MKSAKTNLVPTKAALAKRIGVSLFTLDALLARPGAPKPIAGSGYDFAAVVDFIAANGVSEKVLAQTAPDIRALKAEELTLKCAKLKLAVDRERGLYLLADDVRRTWLSHLQQARAILLSCPAELAPSLCGLSAPEIERRLTERMDAALAVLSTNPTGSGSRSHHAKSPTEPHL